MNGGRDNNGGDQRRPLVQSPALSDDAAICRILVERMPNAVLLLDLDGHIVATNPAACEVLGYSGKELCQLPLSAIEKGLDETRFEERWVRLASGTPIALDSVWRKRNGKELPVALRMRFLDEGERRFVLLIAMEIAGARRSHGSEQALGDSEQRFRSLVEHSGDAFFLLKRDGSIVDVNSRACDNLGYARKELLELQMSEVDTSMAHSRIGFLWQQMGPGQPIAFESAHNRRDGSTYPAEIRVGPLSLLDREYMFCLVRDLSEQQRVERELRKSNEQIKAWVEELEHRSHEMGQINELGELLQVCQSPAEAYQVISRSARRLFPGDAGAVYVLDASRNILNAVASWGEHEPPERVFGPDDCWSLRRGRLHVETRREGGLICPHVTTEPAGGYLCMPMVGQGETMGLLHLRFQDADAADNGVKRHLRGAKERLAVTIADQISLALANLNLRETLRTQAIRDPLTDLFNRRYMEESLERELHRAARKGVPLGFIMVDIDHFKRVNDNLGHAAGDAVLRDFGSFLRSQVRGEDIACRYGGEEFVLILLDSSLEHTLDRAEGMRRTLADRDFHTKDEGLGPITASFGVAAVPEHGATKHTLLGAADGALYAAKNEGRNGVRVAQFNR